MEDQSADSYDLKLKQVVNKLGETLDNFHSHALSIVSLSEQWQSMESSFAMAEASMAAKDKRLELRKREITMIEKKVENLLSDLKVRQEKLILGEKSLSERVKDLELREKASDGVCDGCKASELMKKEMIEREKLLELWEKEIDEKSVVLDKREKDIDDCRRIEELRKMEFEVEMRKRREEVELRERQVSEIWGKLGLKERELKEGYEGCLKEVRLKQEELIEKEKRMREMCKEMEVTQELMMEKLKVLEVNEMEISDCLGVKLGF